MSMRRIREGTLTRPSGGVGARAPSPQVHVRMQAWAASQPPTAPARSRAQGIRAGVLARLANRRAPRARRRLARMRPRVARTIVRLRNWLAANTFQPAWLPKGLRRPELGYVVAALMQVAAVSVDLQLVRAHPTFQVAGLLVVLVVVLVALSWGAGPSLLATLLGAMLLQISVLQSHLSRPTGTRVGAIELLLMTLTGLVVSVVASQTEHARRKAVAEAAAAETQRHVAEELTSQLTATFEAMADGVVIYDAAGRILRMNPAMRELLALDSFPGYASLPLEERHALMVLPDAAGQSRGTKATPVTDILEGSVLKGATVQELALRALDGRTVRITMSGAPVRDAMGRVMGAVGILRDVSERSRLEQHAHDVLEVLLQMAETLVHAPDPLEWTITDSQADTRVVARRMAELTRSMLGCQPIAVIAVDPKTEIQEPVAAIGMSADDERDWGKLMQGRRLGASFDARTLARLRSGDVLVMELTEAASRRWAGSARALLAPMRIGERLVGYIGYTYGGKEHVYTPEEIALAGAVAKLTALALERGRLLRERAAEHAHALALAQANRRMDEFLAIASHEIKTPLTAIKANAQLLARRLNSSTERVEHAELVAMARQLLDRVERQSGRLQRLVQDLLDSSRGSSGELELRTGPCDLAELVRGAVREQMDIAPGREIALDAPPDDVQVPVVADADRIRQVVFNVLSNALKYSPEECLVRVALRVEGGEARVAVRDQGPGLPPWEHERVWERFYRARGVQVQSGSGVGLGLGLYISRTIVERHGGRVGVESSPGAGSTFWFTLPVAGRVRAGDEDGGVAGR